MMVSELVFTDDEVRSQLEAIGFNDVIDAQVRLFRQDVEHLLKEEAAAAAYRSSSLSSGKAIMDANKNEVKSSSCENLPVNNISSRPAIFDEHCKNYFGSTERSLVQIEKVQIKPKAQDLLPRSLSAPAKVLSGRSVSENGGLIMDSFNQPRKRKVLRHKDGKSVVCEECGSSNSHSDDSNNPHSAQGDCHSEAKRTNSLLTEIRHLLGAPCQSETKSVILPSLNMATYKYRKSDPVSLYHYYKREWERHKAPGEKDHSELRWNIRRTMMMMVEPRKAT